MKFQSLDEQLFTRVMLLSDNGNTVSVRFLTPFREEEPWVKTNWTMMWKAIHSTCVVYFR